MSSAEQSNPAKQRSQIELSERERSISVLIGGALELSEGGGDLLRRFSSHVILQEDGSRSARRTRVAEEEAK